MLKYNRILVVQSIWMQNELEKREIDFDMSETGRPVPKEDASAFDLEIFEILECTCSAQLTPRKNFY